MLDCPSRNRRKQTVMHRRHSSTSSVDSMRSFGGQRADTVSIEPRSTKSYKSCASGCGSHSAPRKSSVAQRRRTFTARRFEATSLDDGIAEVTTDPRRRADAGLEGDELAATVHRAIGMLAESRRAVVRMHLAGYERNEMADLLGWTEAKTRNLLYRGLADLREILESWGIRPASGTTAGRSGARP